LLDKNSRKVPHFVRKKKGYSISNNTYQTSYF